MGCTDGKCGVLLTQAALVKSARKEEERTQLEKQEHGKEERLTNQATGVSEVCTPYHIPAITT